MATEGRSTRAASAFRGSARWAGVLLALILALPAVAQDAEVDVSVEEFGVGGKYRPGSITSIRVALQPLADANLDEATPVWVQWEMPNADGDIAEYGRPITLTRGSARELWLYAPLPPSLGMTPVWALRVYEFVDGERGRELGGTRFSPPGGGMIESHDAMIGVIGGSQMGLDQFRYALGPTTGTPIVSANENTQIVPGIRPDLMPDRWEGLLQFEAIVWGQVGPGDLSEAQASALREWIRRGGHLVIVLPEDSNAWGLGKIAAHGLFDLVPTVEPRMDEDVPLETMLPLVSKAEGLDVANSAGTQRLHVFGIANDPEQVWVDDVFAPIMALPDGRVVVVQRLFGHGRITISGLDVASNAYRSRRLSNDIIAVLPQADVFWNRILGRRADTLISEEVSALGNANLLTRGSMSEPIIGNGNVFRQKINMSGKATAGLGVALLLFLVYWFVAGPGGFFILKGNGLVRHSWLAFAGAAALFTGIAWGSVNLLRDRNISARHVTILDHVARPVNAPVDPNDPQLQRAVSWLSLYLPGYGETSIGIDSLPAQPPVPAQRDLLYSWTAPGESLQTFPDVSRYEVDLSRDPDDFVLRSRSTSIQLAANWLGSVESWGGLLRAPNPIRAVTEGGSERLRGTIINELPGDLQNVRIVWIQNRPVEPPSYAMRDGQESLFRADLGAVAGRMARVGRMYALPVLKAGETFDLATTDGQSGAGLNRQMREVLDQFKDNWMTTGGTVPPSRWRDYIEMLSLYGLVQPPTYSKVNAQESEPERVAPKRRMARELDLSAWATRPCVIVIGYLEESALPIPLMVDGRRVERSEGTTVVRWIYPLDVIEEIAFPVDADGAPSAETDEDAIDG